MILNVIVKPNSKHSRVEKKDNFYIVHVKSPPKKELANEELLELLSEYFKIPKSKIRIISGKTSRRKVVKIG